MKLKLSPEGTIVTGRLRSKHCHWGVNPFLHSGRISSLDRNCPKTTQLLIVLVNSLILKHGRNNRHFRTVHVQDPIFSRFLKPRPWFLAFLIKLIDDSIETQEPFLLLLSWNQSVYLSYSRIAFVISGSFSSSVELASGNSNRILRSGSIGEDITVDLERIIRNYGLDFRWERFYRNHHVTRW